VAFASKKLKSFRSVTNRNGAKRQKRQAARTDHARSGSAVQIIGAGKGGSPQTMGSQASSLPEPTQRTILFPLPD
jgi:hypothetical protein